MVFNHWARSWRATRAVHGSRAWVVGLVRSLRCLLLPREHLALLRLPIYRQLAFDVFGDDTFHHVNHKHYLRQGLSWRERTRLAYEHYAFESYLWRDAYRWLVYAGRGIELWQHQGDGPRFSLRLMAARRSLAEGDLRIGLFVDEEPLHSINFSWQRSRSAGDSRPLPFVTRNQGRWRRDTEVQAAFDTCFPNNSGAYFTYAAFQGIARLCGATEVRAIAARNQCCFEPETPLHFENAYDKFWQALGGTLDTDGDYTLPVPFHQKPLSEVSAKHRKRSAQRRAYWAEIEAATIRQLQPYLSSLQPDTPRQFGLGPQSFDTPAQQLS